MELESAQRKLDSLYYVVFVRYSAKSVLYVLYDLLIEAHCTARNKVFFFCKAGTIFSLTHVIYWGLSLFCIILHIACMQWI